MECRLYSTPEGRFGVSRYDRRGTTAARLVLPARHQVGTSDRKVVIFEMPDVAAEERLIREYVVPAFRRLDGRDGLRWLVFNRYGTASFVDGGQVTLSLFGDVEALAAEERDRWDALVADGLADEWWTDDTEVRIAGFDARQLLRHRMRATASRMSIEAFEEFDHLPDAIDEFDDGTDVPAGWWMCLHHVINQLGYQAGDGEEEIDLLFADIRNRLYALAGDVGTSRAETKVEELVDELDSIPSVIRQHVGDGGEYEHRYADREAFEEG